MGGLTFVVVFGLVAAAGGARAPEVLLLAGIAAISFADLSRRAGAEPSQDRGDATDFGSALAFLAILLAAAYDLGRAGTTEGALGFTVGRRAAGLLVIGAGLRLRQKAARALGRDFLVRLGTRESQTLVQWGPYGRVRHPNYGGLLLVALGTALALASSLALAATLILWLPVIRLRIAREERVMGERFGAAYESYRKRTWSLVAGVY